MVAAPPGSASLRDELRQRGRGQADGLDGRDVVAWECPVGVERRRPGRDVGNPGAHLLKHGG